MPCIAALRAACLFSFLVGGEVCFAQSSPGPIYPTYDGRSSAQADAERRQLPQVSLTSAEKIRDAKARLMVEASRRKSLVRDERLAPPPSCCSPPASGPIAGPTAAGNGASAPDRGTRANQ